MSLQISTFNCRGLQDKFKRKKVFKFFQEQRFDIIFLQETHSDSKDESFWSNQWDGQAKFCSHSSNSCRGVAILFKPSLKVSFLSCYFDKEGRYIVLQVKVDDTELILVNIYGPNKDSPEIFVEVFAKLDDIGNSHIVLAGDLNIAVGPLDYEGSRTSHSNVHAKNMFNMYVEDLSLVDVWRRDHSQVRAFTRHQKCPFVSSRLDYIFVSSDLLNCAKQPSIVSGICSDHCMATLKIVINNTTRGKGYWNLNTAYLKGDIEFCTYIKEKICEFKENHKNTELNANIIWDAFKCTMAGYCMEYCSRKNKERNATKSNLLKSISSLKEFVVAFRKDDHNKDELQTLYAQLEAQELKLNEILDKETAGAMVRSRIRWAEYGERSSKYFCNLEKRCYEKKNIRQLKLANGNIITDPERILQEIHSFYPNLYTPEASLHNVEVASNILALLDIPTLSEESVVALNKPITKGELWNTLKSMSSDKSPGLDGLPIEFYVTFF